MSQVSKCETNLLEDNPATEDAFGTPEQPGAHLRVAKALAELIEKSDGGKVIALEGGWGSGKSTVVGILCGLLEEGSKAAKTHVATFDTWAHEGDPLRRTYLETIIRSLQDKGWIDKSKWDKKLEEIANRRRVTDTTTIPRTTPFGTWFALSLLLVPIGAIFMNAAVRDGISFDPSNGISWAFWLGTPIFLPPLILLIRAVYLLFKNSWDFSVLRQPESWAFLEGKATAITRTETVETPNPTSLEFENYFAQSVKEALSAADTRRLVLILDNLDRVDPKHALEIWSTLQTFLQHHRHRLEPWFRQLWILVPFDPEGLRKVWDAQVKSNVSAGEVATTLAGVPRTSELVSDSFFDKSFQIRFSVPPLVLSDWRKHLFQLLEQALPTHADDRHRIYRVYEQFQSRTADLPTPRQLKLFVNQIGSLHRQWQHQFPLDHVAYFVLTFRTPADFVSALRTGGHPTAEAIRMLGSDLEANLAGLVFGVSSERGQEILLAQPITQALENREIEALDKLKSTHPDGFWLVLEHIAQHQLFGIHGSTLTKMALTFDESKLLEEPQREEVASIRECLKAAGNSVQDDGWGVIDEAVAKGLASLCKMVNEPQFTAARYQAVRGWLRSTGGKQAAKSLGPPIINGYLHLIRTADELGHLDKLQKPLSLPFEPAMWILTCSLIAKEDPHRKYWHWLESAEPLSSLLKLLVDTVNSGQFTQEHARTVDVSYRAKHSETWAALVNALRQRLDTNNNVGLPESGFLLRALWDMDLWDQKNAKDALKSFVEGGHCMHHFQKVSKKGDAATQAVFIHVFLNVAVDGKKRGNVGNSEAGYQNFLDVMSKQDEPVINELTKLSQEYNDGWQWVFDCFRTQKKHPLLAGTLRKILQSYPDEIPVDEIAKRWEDIRAAFDALGKSAELASFIQELAQRSEFPRTVQQLEGGFSLDRSTLYSPIVSMPDSCMNFFATWCAEELKAIDGPQWEADFTGPCNGARLLNALQQQRGTNPELGLPFADGLIAHARLAARGQNLPPPDLQAQWHKLKQCLYPNAIRNGFPKKLLRELMMHGGELSEAYFQLYGPILADPDTLASEDAFSALFSHWVKDGGPLFALAWLSDVLRKNPRIWERIKGTHEGKEFELRIRDQFLSAPSGEVQRLLQEIAEALKFKPLEAPPSNLNTDSSSPEDIR